MALSLSLSLFSTPLSRPTLSHSHVRDVQSAARVKSLDLRPLPGPTRTFSTGGCGPDGKPINSRQFRVWWEGEEGISKINDSALHAFCHFFFFLSFYRPYLLRLSSHLLGSAAALHCRPPPRPRPSRSRPLSLHAGANLCAVSLSPSVFWIVPWQRHRQPLLSDSPKTCSNAGAPADDTQRGKFTRQRNLGNSFPLKVY